MKKSKMQDSVLFNQNLSINLNKDRIDHIRRLVNDYLKNGISEISILNVAEASTVFKVFKELYAQNEMDRKSGNKKDGTRSVESFSNKSKDSLMASVKSFRSILSSPDSLKVLITDILKKYRFKI